jgi:hypothetical protein
MIFRREIPSEVNSQYEGKSSYGDRILYKPGKDDLPDQLTLISRELVEQVENADRLGEKDVWENWDEE